MIAVLVLLSWAYAGVSYLLLLRDAFLLERLGLSLGAPWFEPMMLSLGLALKAPFSSSLGIALVLVGMIAAYAWLLFKPPILKPKQLLLVTIGLYLPMLLSFPILSTDVFDYTNANRIFLVHKQNPWVVPAASFSTDSEMFAGSWLDRPSIYPPLTLAFGAIVGTVFGTTMVASIIGYKLMSLLLVLVLCAILSKTKTKQPAWILLWHPLLLIEVLGNLHNDILMSVFVLIMLAATTWRSSLWLSLGWLGSVISKVSTVVLLPFVLAEWKHRRDWILGSLLMFSLLLLALVVPEEVTKSYLATLESQLSILHRSLPQQLTHLIELAGFSSGWVSWFVNGIWMLTLVVIWKYRRVLGLPGVVAWVFIGYLVLAAPMVQPWYGLWFLPSLAFGKRQLWWQATQVVTLFGLLTYVIYNLSLWFSPLWFGWQTVLYLTIVLPLLGLYLWQRDILKPRS